MERRSGSCTALTTAHSLVSKSAVNVAEILNTHIFPYFGVPRILHSDNGREFVNKVIESLLQVWHSGMQLVSGRPRHPQSQGLVERAHHTLQKKLAAEISRNNLTTPPWSDWLPRIICELVYTCMVLALQYIHVYKCTCMLNQVQCMHGSIALVRCTLNAFHLHACRCYEHTSS